ncbi:hypothetical protein ACFX16_043026 [Malus domestica]
MALLHPLVSHILPSSTPKPSTPKLKSNPTPLQPSTLILTNNKSRDNISGVGKFLSRAVVASPLDHDDGLKEDEQEDHKVLVTPSKEEEHGEESVATGYNWTEEWYPLYLTQDLPEDAPLGLTVFNKQLVLYRDGSRELRCYEDRCPHRLEKLSEGHLIDGRLECLYHGWQFERQGKCVKIPQLPSDAKIPRAACVKSYEVRDSQGVVWVWMSHKTPPNTKKLPWFENFDKPGFDYSSTIHELPYDHSILLENLMDPAHIPISHDRTGFSAKRENAQPLRFEVIERSDRGFTGYYGEAKDQHLPFFLRFEAPGVIENRREIVDKNGEKHYSVGLFLCRPTGQGKSVAIMRFGATKLSPLAKLFPTWYFHHISCTVFEQDMGFLSSQNEILSREKRPTKELYLNLKSSDVWVAEYRKWVDRVSNGMPYHVGHSTIWLPEEAAVVEHAPAGLVASVSASQPAKGGVGTMHVPNWSNRYFRHVIHCKGCRNVVKKIRVLKTGLSGVAAVMVLVAILVSGRQWKAVFLVAAAVFSAGAYGCSAAVALSTTNFIRLHKRL